MAASSLPTDRKRSPVAALALLAAAASIPLSDVCAQSPAALDADGTARGLVRSVTQAMISTELPAQVSKIGFKEGEAFKKGDLLVEFDCRRQKAEYASAAAQHREMLLTFENNKVLRQSQAVGRHEVDLSEARVAKAAAEAEALRVRLDQCSLTAPFDGRVLELGLHELETAQPGKPYISIIADGDLEIDLIVPADWMRDVHVGSELTFSVDESKSVHPIIIKRTGASIDPLSQTAKLVAAFSGPAPEVMPGMSGSAGLPASTGN